jgi:pilus assembly protein CpaF
MNPAPPIEVDVVAERSALGGLERWLTDSRITEVLVNGGGQVWIERDGRLQRVGMMSPAAVDGAIERILDPLGRRLDRSTPTVDARLADGSRICAAIPPVAIDGTCLAIRRFAVRRVALGAFADDGTVAALRTLVEQRANVVVSGATNSGKTTLLNALAGDVPSDQRIITIEDVAELRLDHPHVLRLESRPRSADGVGEVTAADLLRTALRLRPDRLVVGEIRGAECLTLLNALNTGHDGSLATIHANSAADAVERLATLVLHEVPSWPLEAIRHQIRRCVDVVVHLGRDGDGRRRVVDLHALGQR